MQTLYNAKYQELLDKFNDFLDSYLNDSLPKDNEITKSMVYSVKNGGKRIRPVLCLATAEILGVPFEEVIYYAIAIELIHSYSLVHDDLPAMDNDDYRRGILSTHKKFGEAFGILAGDALLNFAVETCLKKPNITQNDINAIKLLFDYAGFNGMIKGQTLDLLNEKKPNGNLVLLKEIYLNKTCKLLTIPVLIPSILKDGVHFNSLREYGENLGFTFQIVDDIIDKEGDFEAIGKTPGKDDKTQKFTSISLLGIDKAKELAKDYYDATVNSVKGIDNNTFLLELAKNLFTRNK